MTTWEPVARRALAAYELTGAELTLVQHSENVTFRVQLPSGELALLRLHVPVVPEFGAHGANRDMIASELAWLDALHAALGPVVPLPWRNREGDWVTTLGEGLHASLLSWLPGEPGAQTLRRRQVAALADLVGQIHAHSLAWPRPDGFQRPSWGLPAFRRALERVTSLAQDGRLTPQELRWLRLAFDRMAADLQTPPPGLLEGLIHGDLYRGNFLWDGRQPHLIDFSMCGQGYYLYDVSICLEQVREDDYDAFLRRYGRWMPLPDAPRRWITGFRLLGDLVSLSIWVNYPPVQETLVFRLGALARRAADFVRGSE